jgi:outer membrane protein assembly complex protein YaeT
MAHRTWAQISIACTAAMLVFFGRCQGSAIAQEAHTSTESVEILHAPNARTATRGIVVTEVLVDPRARSVCLLPKSVAQPGVVTLSLEGLQWRHWPDFCERLVKYLRADKLPYDDTVARGSERLLASTGYFAAVHCTITSSAAELDCAMSPELMVRDIRVEGNIPFVLLKEDVERQVYLRSGKLLPNMQTQLESQAKRVENYFERQGFFGSKAQLTPEELSSGAEPNRAIRLRTHVESGVTVTLRKIRIDGDADATNDEIDSIFYHYWVFAAFPRRFSPERFDEDMESFTKLLQKRNYPDARVDGTYDVNFANRRVDIVLRVRQGPKLVLNFRGNRALDRGDLLDLSTFIKNGSTDVVEIENTRKRIVTAYQKKGYFAADVQAQIAHTDSSSAAKTREILYTIAEGPTAEVKRVTFTGNKHFTPDKLAKMKTKVSGFLSTGRWIDDVIRRDQQALVHFYRQNGFAQPAVSVDRDIIGNGELEVKFTIEEGPLRTVSSLLIEGAPKTLTQKDLRRHLKLVDGAPFVESQLASDRRALLQLLAESGYPRAQVGRSLKLPYKTDGGFVEIAYTIDPGKPSLLGGVLVRGNFRTSESVINDELSLSPGDPLNLVAVSDATQRLRQLGVFASAELDPLDTWKTSTTTWLLAVTQERDRRTIDAVFGFRTDEYFSVGADAHDNNFLGHAIRVDLSARLSNADRVLVQERIGLADRLTARVTAPHPLGLPFNMQYTASYDYEDKPLYKLREIDGTASAFRTLIQRTACDVCPNLVGTLFYRLSSTDLQIPLFEANGAPGSSAQNTPQVINALLDIPNQTIARVGPRLTFDRVDSPVDPRSGFSGDLTLELAHPRFAGPLAGAPPFWRLLASLDTFIPLGEPLAHSLSESTVIGGPLVLAVGIRYGVAHPLRSHEPVPLTETFAYGGDLSVRGIQEKASTVAFLGANYLLTSSFELRWYFLQTAIGAFQIASLTDVGNASYHLGNILDAPTISAGAAFRYISPIGPVSIAYAIPVVKPQEIVSRDPDAIPRLGRIHFAFGYTF